MKNKKTILVILIGIMVFSLGFLVTKIGAWLTDTDEIGPVTFTVGEVKYELSSNSDEALFVGGLIVPGQNIVEDNEVTIKNESNVDSEIRFYFTLTYGNGSGDAIDEELFSTITMNSAWTAGDSGYPTTPSVDGPTPSNFYYLTSSSSYTITPETYTAGIGILTHLVLDGSKVGNDFANVVFTIRIVFQAKQADHVNWSDMGSIDFSTGLAG